MDLKNKLCTKPHFLVVIILIILSILLTIYWFFNQKNIVNEKNSDIESLTNITNTINNINSQFTICINDKSIHVKNSIDSLEKNIPILEDCKSQLESLTLSDDSKQVSNDLATSLNLNINLYNSLLEILREPKIPDLNDKFDKLQTLHDDFTISLNNFNSTSISYNFSNDSELFISNSLSYIKNIIKINRDLSMTKTNVRSYLTNISPIYRILNDSKDDLFPSIEKYHEGVGDLKLLDTHIYRKLLNLSTAKNNLIEIPVPNSCTENYTLLSDSIKSCEKYLDTLSTAVKKNIDNKSFNDYEDSEIAYKEFKESLSEFYDNYVSLK